MKTNFFLLYALIFLEAGFIYYSYMDTLGVTGTLFPAFFYILIALVDIYSSSRKYAILVLLTTIGIAFPRVLIKVEELNERVLNKQVEELKIKNPEFSPVLQDCGLLVAWDLEGRNTCMKANKQLLEKANEHNFKIKSETQLEMQKVKIGAKEYAELSLYGIISICLPLSIFILLFDTKSAVKSALSPIAENEKPDIQQQNLHITNTIYTGAIPEKDEETIIPIVTTPPPGQKDLQIEEENPVISFLLSKGIDYEQRFQLSSIPFDYYLKSYNLLVDIADNSVFPSLARACLAKKRLSHSLGYNYLILSPYCMKSLVPYFASKIPQYTLMIEDYRSQTFLHSISVQLSAKEISELTQIPPSSIYRKLAR